MIDINNISKTYGNIKSLDCVNAQIGEGSIFGLVGSNGSGKSTLLRVMCGVLKPDEGSVNFDGENIYENYYMKRGVLYLSDEQYFLPNSTIAEMAKVYSAVYPDFSYDDCQKYAAMFGLDTGRKISTFSKGMQKQAAILLALASHPKYLLCDETFDGLDPVMRQLVKKILAALVAEHGVTPIIASHNLRELEDICDHIGLLHKGGILFESEIDTLKDNIHTVQALLPDGADANSIFAEFDKVSIKIRGSMVTLVVRGVRDEIDEKLKSLSLPFYEIIPLTLEEIFISEMEERGYDYSDIIV